MVNKPKSIAVISCSLIMLSTFLAFYLLFENLFDEKVQWISMLLLLLSEAILMLKFVLIHKQTIIADAHITSSVIHIVISILIAALFIVFNEEAIRLFILINVLLLSAVVISDLLIYYTQFHATAKDNEQLSSRDMVSQCISQIHQLSLRHKASSFYEDLCKIEELLKYSDDTAITGDEVKIGSLISELAYLLDNEGADTSLIYTKINDTTSAIQVRTAQMKVIKRGRY